MVDRCCRCLRLAAVGEPSGATSHLARLPPSYLTRVTASRKTCVLPRTTRLLASGGRTREPNFAAFRLTDFRLTAPHPPLKQVAPPKLGYLDLGEYLSRPLPFDLLFRIWFEGLGVPSDLRMCSAHVFLELPLQIGVGGIEALFGSVLLEHPSQTGFDGRLGLLLLELPFSDLAFQQAEFDGFKFPVGSYRAGRTLL